jgi:hypothetical protein
MQEASLSSADQQHRVIGVMISLAASLVAGTEAAGTIAGVSGMAGLLTLALSFYALMLFYLHLAENLPLIRPAVVRFWHAVVLVCVTAAANWIVVLPHVAKSTQTVAAFWPLCVVAALIAGPWHGLLPDSRRKAGAQVLEKEERSSEDE